MLLYLSTTPLGNTQQLFERFNIGCISAGHFKFTLENVCLYAHSSLAFQCHTFVELLQWFWDFSRWLYGKPLRWKCENNFLSLFLCFCVAFQNLSLTMTLIFLLTLWILFSFDSSHKLHRFLAQINSLSSFARRMHRFFLSIIPLLSFFLSAHSSVW